LTVAFCENYVSRETSIFMPDFLRSSFVDPPTFVQLSTRRHFRTPRRTALSPTNGPLPQPHSAFERCRRPLPTSSRIIRMLCTLAQRRAGQSGCGGAGRVESGRVRSGLAKSKVSSESRRLSRRVRNLLFEAIAQTTLACQAVHLILAIIAAAHPGLSFRAEWRGFFFLVRFYERAALRSRGIPLRLIAEPRRARYRLISHGERTTAKFLNKPSTAKQAGFIPAPDQIHFAELTARINL
jgi:hypothetical protein